MSIAGQYQQPLLSFRGGWRSQGFLRCCKAGWVSSGVTPGNSNGVYRNETNWIAQLIQRFFHLNKQCSLAHNNCAFAAWSAVIWPDNLVDACHDQFCACLHKITSELGWKVVKESCAEGSRKFFGGWSLCVSSHRHLWWWRLRRIQSWGLPKFA